MNYIENLTEEEKSFICETISGKVFKELFKHNEQEFLKIQKGFRAKSLTDEKALSIAKTKIKQPFVSAFINSKVERWIKEIQSRIKKLHNFYSLDDAKAMAINGSIFKDNFDLYFKITGTPLDAEEHSEFSLKLDSIKSNQQKDLERENRLQTLEAEKKELSKELKRSNKKNELQKAEYDQEIQKINQENDELSLRLKIKEAEILNLKRMPKTIDISDSSCLVKYDDTKISLPLSFGSDETVSLCEVVFDSKNDRRLKRYADLKKDGSYVIFRRNKDLLPLFKNRDLLFTSDGPTEEGYFGTWSWSAETNTYDSSKDYIRSHYTPDFNAIEIFFIDGVKNLEDLVDLLKKGVTYYPHARRIMFSYKTSDSTAVGILCNVKDLKTKENKVLFPKEWILVPVYKFNMDETLQLRNKLIFYSKVFIGIPDQLFYLKTPLEIVKEIVLSSISWSTYKATEISRAKRQEFRSFLEAIPTDEVVSKIGIACHCSKPAAQELLDEFMSNVWQYLDGESLEDKVLHQALSVDPELQKRTKDLILKDWEIENESLLKHAEENKKVLQAEIETASKKLQNRKEALKQVQSEEKRLKDKIAEEEKLAEDVEKAVAEQIQKAQNNAADFIANMAFVAGKQKLTVEHVPLNTNEITERAGQNLYTVSSENKNPEDLEIHHTWEDVIDTAMYELREAGVNTAYTNGLATFLCAAYIQKQPLLLIGPNAIDIAQAFSAAVTAKKYGILKCEGHFSQHSIEKIGVNGETIVIINNLLANNWMTRLPEIFSNKDIFYMATYPYSEDIQVEPTSLYNFVLPVFTETFTDKMASGKYDGGYFSDDFKPYEESKDSHRDLVRISKLRLNPLLTNCINSLVSTMYGINSSVTPDDEFMFCIFPVVYASASGINLEEKMNNLYLNLGVSTQLKHDLQFILEKWNG